MKHVCNAHAPDGHMLHNVMIVHVVFCTIICCHMNLHDLITTALSSKYSTKALQNHSRNTIKIIIINVHAIWRAE